MGGQAPVLQAAPTSEVAAAFAAIAGPTIDRSGDGGRKRLPVTE
jgi:hypothetical protein